jgi:hypothetical protein
MFRAEMFAFLQVTIVALIVVNFFLAACLVVVVRWLRKEMDARRPAEKVPAKLAALPPPPSPWRNFVADVKRIIRSV